MARSTWEIQIRDSNSDWVHDAYIYRPNSDLVVTDTANVSTINLLDGSIAFINATTARNNDPIALSWDYVSEDIQTLIRYYIDAKELVKIITHLSSEVWIGRFTNCSKLMLVGVSSDEDAYNVTATFVVQQNVGV